MGTRRAKGTRGGPRIAELLATVVCVLAILPALATALLAVSMIGSAVSGSGTSVQAAQEVLIVIVYAAGLMSFVAMRRSESPRKTWILACLTIILVVAASAPIVYAFSQAFLEEWCEYQPGGRGNPSQSIDDIPAVC
ncbi:hypothetical protein [Arthrobacter tecti]